MSTRLFSELGLSPESLKAIHAQGFEQASPIQAEAIPLMLQGADVVGQSQTGSGKTLAFALPAVEKVDAAQPTVQVLILCPTRELAIQVAEEVHQVARFKPGVRALPIYGGQSYDRQFYGLSRGAQLVIGTPGRLLDHLRRGTLKLNSVRLVVLDEADVMLDMGFRADIEAILQAAPAERQTVFFSATLPRAIRELIDTYAKTPRSVRIEQKALTVPTVEQVYYEVGSRFKVELLTRLIDLHDLKLGIIFCNTKRMVDDLVDHLNTQGYSADRLHGDMNQAQRDRVMNRFRRSGLEFLVATDVAARGLDVDNVQVVFNYDLPYDPEDYVHRIGRTGRAGRAGRAISFVAGRELFQVQQIERFARTRIQRAQVPSLDEVEEARTESLVEKLRTTLQGGQFPRRDHLVGRLLEEGFTSTDIVSALLHQLQGGEPSSKAPAPPAGGAPAPRPPAPPPPGPPAITEATVPAPAPTSVPRPSAPARRGPRPVPASPRPGPPRRPGPMGAKERFAGRRPFLKKPPAATPRPEKVSRKPAADQLRLFINAGSQMGVGPGDVVGAIMGETGLPAEVVGGVDVRERHLFVDVVSDHARAIIAKLNRTTLRGHRIKVKTA